MLERLFYLVVMLIMAFLVIIIDRIIFKVFIGHFWPRIAAMRLLLLRWILYAPFLLIYFIFLMSMIFAPGENERPSPVDASLVAQMTQEQIDSHHLEQALDSLRNNDYIARFSRSLRPGDRELSLRYTFTFICSTSSGGVSIRIHFHRDEQRLIDRLPRWPNCHERRNSEVIINENNTQVFLHASFVPVSHGMSVSYRLIRTELRLGNVHITLSEHGNRDDSYPNASTEFIRFLYELLTTYE